MKTQTKLLVWVALLGLACVQCLPALASEGSFQRTLQVSGPVHLDVTTGSGTIQVRSGGSGQVQITGHIKATNWFGSNAEDKVKHLQDNPPIQQSGNDIRIGHIDDPELRRNVSISYEIVVPAQTEAMSHTGSGSQTISGIQGPLEASTGSGNLKISDIGNTVRADTGSGSIDVDRVKGNVRAKTGSGSSTPPTLQAVSTPNQAAGTSPLSNPRPVQCVRTPDQGGWT